MKIMPTYIEPRAAQVELGYPEEQPAHLKLEIPFGTIDLKPGAGGSIVSGHVVYNIAELKPTYSVKGRTVRIRQDYRVLLPIEGRNRWEMNLGTSEPYGLAVRAGRPRPRSTCPACRSTTSRSNRARVSCACTSTTPTRPASCRAASRRARARSWWMAC